MENSRVVTRELFLKFPGLKFPGLRDQMVLDGLSWQFISADLYYYYLES